MNSNECTEYHELPNIHSDDPSHSDDIQVLKVFQDILAHRSYIQTNYKLGKVLKYHVHAILFTKYNPEFKIYLSTVFNLCLS